MTIELIASGSLAVGLPGAAALQAGVALTLDGELAAALALLAELELELPSLKLEAEAAASLAADLSAQLSLDASVTIAASLSYAADAQLALAANLSGPSFNAELAVQVTASLKVASDLAAKLAAKAAAVAELTARIGKLKATISLAAKFGADLLAGGVRIYRYDGPVSGLGLSNGSDGLSPNARVQGAVVVTDLPVSYETMKNIFQLVGEAIE